MLKYKLLFICVCLISLGRPVKAISKCGLDELEISKINRLNFSNVYSLKELQNNAYIKKNHQDIGVYYTKAKDVLSIESFPEIWGAGELKILSFENENINYSYSYLSNFYSSDYNSAYQHVKSSLLYFSLEKEIICSDILFSNLNVVFSLMSSLKGTVTVYFPESDTQPMLLKSNNTMVIISEHNDKDKLNFGRIEIKDRNK